MTAVADTAAEALRLDALFRAKARAEIEAAETRSKGVRGQGDVLAEVLLVKGASGPGDIAAGRALAGEDGTAIGRALDALGLPKARYAFCTRPGKATAAARIDRVRALTEAIDPRVVVLLDAEAAGDFAAAYEAGAVTPGEMARIAGRRVVAVDGFEASLADEARKRRVWGQLRALAPAQPER